MHRATVCTALLILPTVVCDPAGGGLHTAGEWVGLQPVRAYEAALTSLIPAFSGTRCRPSPSASHP